MKLRKLEQGGLSDDETLLQPPSKVPIGPPSVNSAVKTENQKESIVATAAQADSMDNNVRKICEQLAQIQNISSSANLSVD